MKTAFAVIIFSALFDQFDCFRISSVVKKSCRFKNRISKLHMSDVNEAFYAPPKYISNVVDDLKNKKVTVADVAAKSGGEISKTRKDLMALAAVTGALLDVTESGEILYTFPSNTNQIILQKSVKRKAQEVFNKMYPTLFYLFRVSFGFFLVLSMVLVTLSFIAISSSSSSDDDDRGNRRSSSVSTRLFIDPIDIANVFYYNRSGRYYMKRPEEMNFFEACFSFLFGDGDPNKDHETAMNKLAAQVIRSNNGVVLAEQLAPFLKDPPPLPREFSSGDSLGPDTVVDESWVLPLALRYGGSPQVTPEGTIVYDFEDLTPTVQIKGDSFFENKNIEMKAQYFESEVLEKNRPFSLASNSQKLLAGGLGALNLFGVLALRGAINSALIERAGSKSITTILALAKLYPLLAGYAILFVSVPTIRYFWNLKENEKIEERNKRRKQWMRLLTSRAEPLIEKEIGRLDYVKNRANVKPPSQDKIIFSSDSPATRNDD